MSDRDPPSWAPVSPLQVIQESQPVPLGPEHKLPIPRTSLLGGHLPFYAVALLAFVLMSAIYLLGRASGSDSAWSGLPLDDNWIHLVYARSLAQGGGFSYNPGVPEAGMSSPFWVVLLAGVYKLLTPLGVSPQWCAKILSMVFAFGVPLASYHLALVFKVGRKWAWAAGLLVAVEPSLAYGNVAGMEVPLFSLLLLAALIAGRKGHHLTTGILLGLSVVTRAEGTLNAVLIGGLLLVPAYLKRQNLTVLTLEELKLGLKVFLPALLLGGCWALYNYSINGHWVPNTYYVKHNFALGVFNLENLANTLQGYIGHLALFQGLALPVTLALLALSVWALVAGRQTLVALPLVLIPLVQVYAFSINIKVSAEAIPWTYFTRRYLDFLLPILIVLMASGAEFLWGYLSRHRARWVIIASPLVLAGALLALGLNLARGHSYLVAQYSWNTQNVEQVNVAIWKWVGVNLPAGASIAVTDAGAIRFWARPDHTVIDFLGLNCWPCVGQPMEFLLAEFNPDYLVVFRPALTGEFGYEELTSVSAGYNTILGGDELVVVQLDR